ncbi:adenosylcobinamide-phosphate synthase CbiB [Natrarchaeobius chitinivorans]|uniref:Probable cobalamin biosynthesis protein CobD n=1 Tax=Natrarchaeobius chitinivorans TaxID=1679083 RepID=A0A3N6PFZ8_NATCH|nr:adenosylcobinamide-phosphate synthase CbiB [Natrarchaeobius chitinivorans]RQG96625.1 cobalamin biosynthesis protein CobD [Natrarchaeobius chitinivorans]
MALTTLALIALAFSLDLLVGEPRNALHPVAWFGRLVDAVDREWSDDERGQRRIGVAIALVLPLVPAAAVGALVFFIGEFQPLAGAILAGIVLFLSISLRSLLELTDEVVVASDGNLETARERVRGLVGRDASTLSPEEIRSAAIESAAENLADGLVATLLPFALLAPVSLPLAGAVAVWVKAVNTLDSMLGYPSKPIGTASARLDDVVMWIPARLTAAAIAAVAGDPLALRRARSWAKAPASPNSGWPMATLACVLSIRLVKPGRYDLNPDAALPTLEDGDRALAVVGTAAVVSVLIAAVGSIVVDTFGVVLEFAAFDPIDVRGRIGDWIRTRTRVAESAEWFLRRTAEVKR